MAAGFLDMDRRPLDDAYDQEIYAPNRHWWSSAGKAASERARAVLGAPKRVAYGRGIRRLDIFDCGIKGAPVNVFVHGGAWRRNVAADYALQAEPRCGPARISVLIGLHQCRSGQGDLFPMYEQVRRALAWIWNNAQKLWRQPRPALCVGAFSGSHLPVWC